MKIHFIENEQDLIGISHSDNVLFLCKSCYTYTVKCMRSMIAKPFLCRSCICRENILKPEAIKRKQETSLKIHGSKTFTNREKAYKTYKKHTGYENPWQNPEHHKKLQTIFEDKFGGISPFSNETILNKAIKNRDYNNVKETCLKLYGVSAGFQTKTALENRNKTLKEKYGTDKIMHVPEIAAKTHKKIKYNDLWFDSMPELNIYNFLIEHNINFEYQPKVNFTYMFEGKEHKYYPDFYIEGEYYEYKGTQFFKNHDINERMINPYDRSKDDLYEAKHQCMLKNDIHIITNENDLYKLFS